MTVKRQLRELREFFDTPDRWCQDHYAVDEHGFAVLPFDPDAQKFCLLGAVNRLELDQALSWMRNNNLAPERVNDENPFDVVMQTLDQWIEEAPDA